MTCEEALDEIEKEAGPRLCADRLAEAHAHVASCPRCAAVLRERGVAVEPARSKRAPASLHARVLDTIEAQDHHDQRIRWLRRGSVPAVMMAVAVALVAMAPEGPTPEPYVEDQLRRAPLPTLEAPSQRADGASFVARELGVSFTASEMPFLRLVAAEICILRGRRAAMLTYEIEGGTVAHYVHVSHGGERSPEFMEPREGDGPTVVGWASDDLEHALVSHDAGPELVLAAARRAYEGGREGAGLP